MVFFLRNLRHHRALKGVAYRLLDIVTKLIVAGFRTRHAGRQLDQLNIGNVQYTYKYNADGLRVSKSNGTDTYTYRWDGTTLLSQDHNGTTVVFLYNDGELVGFNYNGNNYYYGIDNLGVIHYVYNESGEIVVTYTYDAWGNTISVTGNSTLISGNPIRYKSYYYDNETGFYYLQSRYYDPAVGRFINADEEVYHGATGTVLSYNAYAYCENNPVNSMDPTGDVPWQVKVGLAAGIASTIWKVTKYILNHSFSPKTAWS